MTNRVTDVAARSPSLISVCIYTYSNKHAREIALPNEHSSPLGYRTWCLNLNEKCFKDRSIIYEEKIWKSKPQRGRWMKNPTFCLLLVLPQRHSSWSTTPFIDRKLLVINTQEFLKIYWEIRKINWNKAIIKTGEICNLMSAFLGCKVLQNYSLSTS